LLDALDESLDRTLASMHLSAALSAPAAAHQVCVQPSGVLPGHVRPCHQVEMK
jgi:hypothetical protein